jgi:TolB-like protein/tetratricopeptide (TPR) repeat protein
MNGSKRTSEEDRTTPADRLESWKEIAGYLRRGIRTVVRWEKEEGLPVRRHVHKKLGTIYAHRSELDAWWDSRRADVTGPAVAARHQSKNAPARVLIAVLPFENLSGVSEEEYFADGLTEEMISQLGRFNPKTLGVIARTTVMQYKGRSTPIRRIADELNVDYVMEGSVRREADRVRVTAQLIHGHDETHRWAESYDRSMRSMLGLQRELAADIGREIRLKLSPERQASFGDMDTVNPEAYLAHSKGRQLLNAFTPESVRRSVEYFQRAIDSDPTYAASYASLAEAYEQLPMWVDAPPVHTLPLALQAAEHALALDPNLPEAYVSLGLIHAYYLWDWPKAEGQYQRALELNPSCSPARQWYAEFLAEMGRIDDALAILEPARTHDPLSRGILATRAFVFLGGRRFDKAIAEAELALEIDPTYAMALIRLGLAYEGQGRHADALRALRRAQEAAPGLWDCTSLLGYTHARAGDRQEALKQLNKLHRLAERRYVPAFLFANPYLALGDHDEALRFMEKEYDARGWYLLLIRQSPLYDPLRSHPRFQALMRRMNFPIQ